MLTVKESQRCLIRVFENLTNYAKRHQKVLWLQLIKVRLMGEIQSTTWVKVRQWTMEQPTSKVEQMLEVSLIFMETIDHHHQDQKSVVLLRWCRCHKCSKWEVEKEVIFQKMSTIFSKKFVNLSNCTKVSIFQLLLNFWTSD